MDLTIRSSIGRIAALVLVGTAPVLVFAAGVRIAAADGTVLWEPPRVTLNFGSPQSAAEGPQGRASSAGPPPRPPGGPRRHRSEREA